MARVPPAASETLYPKLDADDQSILRSLACCALPGSCLRFVVFCFALVCLSPTVWVLSIVRQATPTHVVELDSP